jgi:protein-tyrosine phosphatase
MVTRFIEEARKKGKVLVHCAAGISRSSALVAAYIMKLKHIPYDSAMEIVRNKHLIAFPNSGYSRQLVEYQEELKIKAE